jgi:ubiquinone/menaquinone biosynthesis C-methylase UbiE
LTQTTPQVNEKDEKSNLAQQLAVADHYDKVWSESVEEIGESWESWPFFRMKPSAHAAGIAALGDLKGKQVLDLGCGAGYSTLELAQAGALVTALDLSAQGLSATEERLRKAGLSEQVRLVRSSVEQLPFAENSFDLVFAQNFLMHVSTAKVGQEAWRVLKPGGKAVFIEPLAHHPLVKLYRKLFSSYKSTQPRWCSRTDMAELAAPFARAETRTFYLFSVLASANTVQSRPWLLNPAWAVLNGLDQLVTRFVPASRQLCWVAVTILTK